MCGISLLLQRIKLQNIELLLESQVQTSISGTEQTLGDFKTYLHRRGPDSFKTHKIHINNNDNPMTLSFSGAVLHLRGSQINVQPLMNNNGNILLWNGEVFDGIDLKENDNDTMQIFKLFNECSVFDIHKIEGPFAFIYYKEKTNEIWFGRDCFGRRSLLFAFNDKTQCFALSSIPYKSETIHCNDWNEISNKGIFSLSLNDYSFTKYLWKDIKQEKENMISLFNNKVFSEIKYAEIIHAFLNVLCRAIKKRVLIPESSKLLRHKYLMDSSSEWINDIYWKRDKEEINKLHKQWMKQQRIQYRESSIGILYSGGIDSQILAALCDRFVPPNESIDLINVVCGDDPMLSPDRLTAINGLLELKECINSKRNWRLIKVNISYNELCDSKQHILSLIYPQKTIMDFNIGNILWFGSRGIGTVKKTHYQWIKHNKLIRYSHLDLELKEQFEAKIKSIDVDSMVTKQIEVEFDEEIKKKKTHLIRKQKRKRAKQIKREIINEIKNGIYKEEKIEKEEKGEEELYISSSRVLLSGFGSDELMGGYGRHRTAFKINGINGLKEELNKDFNRLWKRNLGRDDRLISDNGRESRWPFLDEEFISFIRSLPLEYVCNLNDPIGFGDKKLLRDCGKYIGLKYSWSLVKRAIQFGSRIANNKVAGYIDINDELSVNDLINCQIYDNQINDGDQLNIKITKKYNKKNGKNGFE